MPVEELYAHAWFNPLAHNSLQQADLILEVKIPNGTNASSYIQASEKTGFDWALVSCAAAVDYHTDETFPNLLDVVNYFNEGRKNYRSGNWDLAIKNFQQALQAHPEDHLSNTYIERCEVLKQEAPADWDGVWRMTSK